MLILKLIASAIILSSCAIIGFSLARDCAKRPVVLRELQAALQMLENEISFMSNLLQDAFIRIAEAINTQSSVIFTTAAENLGILGTQASEAWEKSIKQHAHQLGLKSEDISILISFGKMLGNSDTFGQVNNIRLASAQLKLQQQKAEDMKKKNEKMYKSLGVLGGMAVIVILF